MDDGIAGSIDDESRIVTNSRMLGGKPGVKDTRIPVSLILNLPAYGYTIYVARPVSPLRDSNCLVPVARRSRRQAETNTDAEAP